MVRTNPRADDAAVNHGDADAGNVAVSLSARQASSEVTKRMACGRPQAAFDVPDCLIENRCRCLGPRCTEQNDNGRPDAS